MADFLSLLCVAATEDIPQIDMEDGCFRKKRKPESYQSQFFIPTSLQPVQESLLASGSFLSTDIPYPSVRSPLTSSKNRSSTSRSSSPTHSGYCSPVDAETGATSFASSIEYSSGANSYLDEHTIDGSSSDDELNDPSVNSKKRKRVAKHQSRRAKPLTVETLYHIFESLHIAKDPATGTYRLSLPALKTAECSSKYFAVTEWQCFRKRIMNHGFEIIDEQQATWIRARPNLQTPDGSLVFDHPELRSKYSTPCKIKCARERGEVIEMPSHEPEEFGESEVRDSPDRALCGTSQPHLAPTGHIAGLGSQCSTDDSFRGIETSLEASLRACLNDAVKSLLVSGQYFVSAGNYDIHLTMRNSCRAASNPNSTTCRSSGRGGLQVRLSSINELKSDFVTPVKHSLV